MYFTGVKRKLKARHFLAGAAEEESSPHSHPYEVEIVCGGSALDAAGFSTDIAAMEAALEEVLREIDEVLLNDLPYFADRPPSLENLAAFIAARVREALAARDAAPVEPMEVRIWESSEAWAMYREEFG